MPRTITKYGLICATTFVIGAWATIAPMEEKQPSISSIDKQQNLNISLVNAIKRCSPKEVLAQIRAGADPTCVVKITQLYSGL